MLENRMFENRMFENRMFENRKKIQNFLEHVIRVSKILIEKGYLEEEDGKTKIRVLMGIRQRFLSDDYMRRTPKGFDIDEIDEMILTLNHKFLDAGKRGYKNTIAYILKAVIQGTGVGHRILTEEEEKNRTLVLLQRKLKVQDAMIAVEDAWKLDEKISSRKFILKRQEMLRKDCALYEAKLQKINQERKDIVEEVLYFSDVDEVSDGALEYIQLTSSLESAKKSISKNEVDLKHIDEFIHTYMQMLTQARRWDLDVGVSNKCIEEMTVENPLTTQTSAKNSVESTTVENELISETKILEMQKIINKFLDEDGENMVDLAYETMECAFASSKLKTYAAKSLQEFEELTASEQFGVFEELGMEE